MIAKSFSDAVGRTRKVEDVLVPSRMQHLAATLRGLQVETAAVMPAANDPWPLGWHWCYFNEAPETRDLGEDGHERLGGFIPHLRQARRMWAAGELAFHGEPKAGGDAVRSTAISAIEEKQGRSGPLTFVTLEHTIAQDGRALVSEQQTLVYRDPAASGTRPGDALPTQAPRLAGRRTILPSPVMLFRYSALTLNGHRIHYDADYARSVEGYRGLVFHAPLTATLLMALARDQSPAGRLSRFSFRALNAIEGMAPFEIGIAAERKDGLELIALTAQGREAVRATATW